MEDLSGDLVVESLPWARDILDQAGAMIGAGVSAETVIIAVVAVPIALKAMQLASPYVDTHNHDLRETVRVEKMRQMVEMREKSSPEVWADALAGMDAGAEMLPPPKGKK